MLILLLSILPWILFPLLDEVTTLKNAAMIALALSVGVNLLEVFSQKLKVFTTQTIVFFLLVALVPFLGGAAVARWMDDSALLLTASYLGIICIYSLYTKNYFTSEFSKHPEKAKNRTSTLIWLITFLAIATWEALDLHFRLSFFFGELPTILIPYGFVLLGALCTLIPCRKI